MYLSTNTDAELSPPYTYFAWTFVEFDQFLLRPLHLIAVDGYEQLVLRYRQGQVAIRGAERARQEPRRTSACRSATHGHLRVIHHFGQDVHGPPSPMIGVFLFDEFLERRWIVGLFLFCIFLPDTRKVPLPIVVQYPGQRFDVFPSGLSLPVMCFSLAKSVLRTHGQKLRFAR